MVEAVTAEKSLADGTMSLADVLGLVKPADRFSARGDDWRYRHADRVVRFEWGEGGLAIWEGCDEEFGITLTRPELGRLINWLTERYADLTRSETR